MTLTLLILLFSTVTAQPVVKVETKSLRRPDLPEPFPYQLFNEGFAILEVRIENHSASEWIPDIAAIEVCNQKNKRIKTATPEEITPKLLKYHSGSEALVYSEVYSQSRLPRRTVIDSRTPKAPSGSAGKLSIETGRHIRGILGHHQLGDDPIPPGQEASGFIYLKSKKSGTHLRGWKVILGSGLEAIVR